MGVDDINQGAYEELEGSGQRWSPVVLGAGAGRGVFSDLERMGWEKSQGNKGFVELSDQWFY